MSITNEIIAHMKPCLCLHWTCPNSLIIILVLTAEERKFLLEMYSIEVSTNGFHIENIREQRFLFAIWFLSMLMFRMMMTWWVRVTWCWCWCLTWCWPDGDLLFLRCGLCLEPGGAQVHNLSFSLETYLCSQPHLTKYDDCHDEEIEKKILVRFRSVI